MGISIPMPERHHNERLVLWEFHLVRKEHHIVDRGKPVILFRVHISMLHQMNDSSYHDRSNELLAELYLK